MENNLRQSIINSDINAYYPIYNEAKMYYPETTVRANSKIEMESSQSEKGNKYEYDKYQREEFKDYGQLPKRLKYGDNYKDLETDKKDKESSSSRVCQPYTEENPDEKVHQYLYGQGNGHTSVIANEAEEDGNDNKNGTDDEYSEHSQGENIPKFVKNKSLIVQDNVRNNTLPNGRIPVPGIKSETNSHQIEDESYYERNTEGQYACLSCGTLYNSHYGVSNHFKTTPCGLGSKEKPAVRKDWSYMYTKEANGSFTCNKCQTMYNSMHGIYSHLKTTICGGGHKQKSKARIDWTQFYRKDHESLIVCLNCKSEFVDMHGIHKHLKKTECGANAKEKEFVPKEASVPNAQTPEKKKYIDLFTKNGEVFICNKCSTEYQSAISVRRHLSKTTCGYGIKEYSPAPRKNFKGLYTKSGESVICNSCGGKYQSVNGVHCHLSQTICGFGSKGVPTPKKDYQYMYTKDGDTVSCNNCNAKYTSIFGVHHHLNTTTCGFGTKDPARVTKPRSNILYTKTKDNKLACYACEKTYSQLNGLKYHLSRTPGCAEALGVDSHQLKSCRKRKRKKEKKEDLSDTDDQFINDDFHRRESSDTDFQDASQYLETELQESLDYVNNELKEPSILLDTQQNEPSDCEDNEVQEPLRLCNTQLSEHSDCEDD